MPTSNQQIYLVNGILVDFFGNPISISRNLQGPTGPIGATGDAGLPGVTGPTGSTAATSKFIKEWITAGDERLTITASEISQHTPGFLIDEIGQSLADIQIQLWRVNADFIDPFAEPLFGDSRGRVRRSPFWQLIKPSDYTVNVNGDSGDIFIDLTYRIVNSTLTRAVVIC
jgi:hypothetical protein